MGRFSRLQFQVLVARVAAALRQLQLGPKGILAVASCKRPKKDFLVNFDFAEGKGQ